MRTVRFSCLLALLTASSSLAADDPVETALTAKNFYDSGYGSNLTPAEAGRVDTLARESDDPIVRVRAQHLRVELEKKGRWKPEDREVVVAGLRYLEDKCDGDESIRKLLGVGFTHYTVSTGKLGTLFLIETLERDGPVGVPRVPHPSGGLNLTYDRTTKSITRMTAWGAMAKRP